jgi:hypothetical protein
MAGRISSAAGIDSSALLGTNRRQLQGGAVPNKLVVYAMVAPKRGSAASESRTRIGNAAGVLGEILRITAPTIESSDYTERGSRALSTLRAE